MILEAPAKLNLCLYVGGIREDGLHEIRSIFQPLELADTLEVTEADADEVVCPGVEAPELGARALAALRERGWEAPRLRIEIEKLIPVAAGLGGGSADAAAVLRLAAADLDSAVLREIASELGADVASQLEPRPALVAGAGEEIRTLPDPDDFYVVLVPLAPGLLAGDVYGKLDEMSVRDTGELARLDAELFEAAGDGASPLSYLSLLVNDLQRAATELRPEIGDLVRALDDAGAAKAMVTGSGPTVFGLFESRAAAAQAVERLAGRYDAIATEPRRRPA